MKNSINLNTVHIPVLLNEILESLELKKGDKVFDGTLGGGGYSEKICQAIGEEGILIGTDLDQNALNRVEKRLEKFLCQKKYFLKNYSDIKNILDILEIKKIDKMVLDLGISSDQLEAFGRGISFKNSSDPLNMNLSVEENKKLTASEILNTWSEESMADIFFYYGGERASKKVAAAIVKKRDQKEFKIVSDLVELIESEIGYFYKNKKIHSATKIFQALRITVNNEIENLQKVLTDGVESLKSEGIISVVTFHSLEDKTVKKIFREMENEGIGKRVNKKVVKASREEVLRNKRSRSAKLRVFKKNNNINNMQNRINNKKIYRINNFLVKFEKKVFITSILSIFLLLVSHAFLVFSSVATAYSLDEGKGYLANIIFNNSILESEFSVKKGEVSSNLNTSLVAVREVTFIDSSFEKIVYNK